MSCVNASMWQKIDNKVTAWCSQFTGQKPWQCAMETMWAYGVSITAARSLRWGDVHRVALTFSSGPSPY